MSDTDTTIPVREGIFRDTPEGAVLVGRRCRDCGQLHFPGSAFCLACLGESLEPADLSRVGTLFCETTVHMKTPHFDPPYSVGYVALPEGLKIFTPLRPVEGKPFSVGMPMRVELAPMWREDGKTVIAYRFHPV